MPLLFLLLALFLVTASHIRGGEKAFSTARAPSLPPTLLAEDVAQKATRPEVRIGYMTGDGTRYMRNYPGALNSLLEHVAKETNINVSTTPIEMANFADERMAECPFIYANFAERDKWVFSDEEKHALKAYLENGGFLYIDAGINAAFLREHPEYGQHHSYAEWDASPELKEAFADLFPGRTFAPLKRSDPLFHVFYEGLPDTSLLPDSVREYTIREKWPDGTYSAVALRLKGRIAVLCTPIVAMGWARNSLGQWQTTIRFRVLESTEGLDELLKTAAYGGVRFEVVREDNDKDIIYCQEAATPAWANEPGNKWRVFRYYGSREISDFAHVFYTRLGTNILVHALTQ